MRSVTNINAVYWCRPVKNVHLQMAICVEAAEPEQVRVAFFIQSSVVSDFQKSKITTFGAKKEACSFIDSSTVLCSLCHTAALLAAYASGKEWEWMMMSPGSKLIQSCGDPSSRCGDISVCTKHYRSQQRAASKPQTIKKMVGEHLHLIKAHLYTVPWSSISSIIKWVTSK